VSVVEERLARARAKMVELFGPGGADEKGVLFEMAPQFAQLSREVLFGAVWSDPALETRLRSIATMSALIVLDRQPELKLHMRGALNLGITREQIIALISHLAFYGGMPVAVHSLHTAREVLLAAEAREKKGKGQ